MASQGLVPEELLHEAKTPQAVPITQLKLNSSSRRITSSNYENSFLTQQSQVQLLESIQYNVLC